MQVTLVNESLNGPVAASSGWFLEGKKGVCIAVLLASGEGVIYEELNPSEIVMKFQYKKGITTNGMMLKNYPSERNQSENLMICNLKNNHITILSGSDFSELLQTSGGCEGSSPSHHIHPFIFGGCGPHSKVIVSFPDHYSLKTTIVSSTYSVRSEKIRRIPSNMKLQQVVPLHTRDCSRRFMVAAFVINYNIQCDPYPLGSIEIFCLGKGDVLEPGPWGLRNIHNYRKGIIVRNVTDCAVVQDDPMTWPSSESFVDPLVLVTSKSIELISSRGLECVVEPPTNSSPLQLVKSTSGVFVEQGRVAKSSRCWRFVTLTKNTIYSFVIEDCLTADKKPRRYFTIEIDNEDLTMTTKTRQHNDLLKVFHHKHETTSLVTTSTGICLYCPGTGIVLYNNYSTTTVSRTVSINPVGSPICLSDSNLLFPSGCNKQSVNQFVRQCQLLQSPDLQHPASLQHAAEVFFIKPTPVAVIAFERGASIVNSDSLEFSSSEFLENARVRCVSDSIQIDSQSGNFSVFCSTSSLLAVHVSQLNILSVLESITVDLEICDTHASPSNGSIYIAAAKGNVISNLLLTPDEGKAGIDSVGKQEVESAISSICIDVDDPNNVYYSLWDTDTIHYSNSNLICTIESTARSLTCVTNKRLLAWCVSGFIKVIKKTTTEMMVVQSLVCPSLPSLRFSILPNNIICCGSSVLDTTDDQSVIQYHYCIPNSSSKIRSISNQSSDTQTVIWIDSLYNMFLGSSLPIDWNLNELVSTVEESLKVIQICLICDGVIGCLCLRENEIILRIEHMKIKVFELCTEIPINVLGITDDCIAEMSCVNSSEVDSVTESSIYISISTHMPALIVMNICILMLGNDTPAVTLSSSQIHDLGSSSKAAIAFVKNLSCRGVVVSTNFDNVPGISIINSEEGLLSSIVVASPCYELKSVKDKVICLSDEGVDVILISWPVMSLCCHINLISTSSIIISDKTFLISTDDDNVPAIQFYRLDEGSAVPSVMQCDDRTLRYSNNYIASKVYSEVTPFPANYIVSMSDTLERLIAVGSWGMFYIMIEKGKTCREKRIDCLPDHP